MNPALIHGEMLLISR